MIKKYKQMKATGFLSKLLNENINIFENQCNKFFCFVHENDKKKIIRYEIKTVNNIEVKTKVLNLYDDLNHLNYYLQRLTSPLVDTLENKIDELLYLKISSEENFYKHTNIGKIYKNLQFHYKDKIKLRENDVKILINNKSPIILSWYKDIILNSWCQLPKKIDLLCSLIEVKNIKKVKNNSIYEMRNIIYHSAYFLNYINNEKNEINEVRELYRYVCEEVSFGKDEKEYLIQNSEFCISKIEYYLKKIFYI